MGNHVKPQIHFFSKNTAREKKLGTTLRLVTSPSHWLSGEVWATRRRAHHSNKPGGKCLFQSFYHEWDSQRDWQASLKKKNLWNTKHFAFAHKAEILTSASGDLGIEMYIEF